MEKRMIPITARRPWTEEEKENARALRQKGVSFARIADMLDRTENAVRIFFGEGYKRYKLPDRTPTTPWMDEQQIIREWKQAKDPEAQILILAELNDVSVPEIRKIIKRGTA